MSLSKRICKIVILDEVNCTYLGLTDDHVSHFYNDYAVNAPNYFFNPKFKMGAWDGKIRYFQKTGRSYTKLLDEMIPKLIALRYAIAIDDRRDNGALIQPEALDENFFSFVPDPITGLPWKVRDYQINAVNAVINNGGGVIVAGTGAGKTSVAASIAKLYENAGNLRSIIIVPDRSLTMQTLADYQVFGLDVGEYSGKRKDMGHQHVVSTWQALKNNPELIQQFNVVICDECQGLKGVILSKLLNDYGKNIPYRFGVTGTLPKEPADQMAIKIAVGTVQYEVPAHELIASDVLSNLEIGIIQHEIDFHIQYEDFLTQNPLPIPTYSQFCDSYFPDWASERDFLNRQKTRVAWIANFLDEKRSMPKGNTLCLVNSVAFGKKLASLIPDAIFLYGQDDAKVRKKEYDAFATNDNMLVIATSKIASTGLNIPRIFHLVTIDSGKSFVRVIQSIGRGLRKAHDKDFVNVWDLCSDLKYSKKHLRERLRFYKEQQYLYKKTVVKL